MHSRLRVIQNLPHSQVYNFVRLIRQNNSKTKQAAPFVYKILGCDGPNLKTLNMIRVSIPSYQKVEGNGDSYTAYRVDVFQSGSYHTLHKRYSEFEELHKQLKKLIATPEFPPKKVLKFSQKIVEQRRVALEAYLQGVLESETIPRSFLKFLDVQLPRSGSFDSLDVGLSEPTVTHQPMVGFTKDSFLQENYRSILPDIVSQGVQNGLYSFHQEDLLGLVR